MSFGDLPLFNYTLSETQLADIVHLNKTLNLHMQVSAPNRVLSEDTSVPRFLQLQRMWPECPLPAMYYFNSTLPLVSYHKKNLLQEESNLFSDLP